MTLSRRQFLLSLGALVSNGLVARGSKHEVSINTVLGEIPISGMGTTLIHEHILVDFIGADKISYDRWNKDEVIKRVLPYLEEAKKAGVKTFFDCTPAFLGRDPLLLKTLSERSGLHIITNTGYYGAVDNKYLPAWIKDETAESLAQRWIKEHSEGIENTGVRPGFIKISVNEGKLSELHQKLVKAAALTHLQTGLTICSHTGKAPAAFEQIDILKSNGVQPDAFVWVHAQAESDKSLHTKAAQMGAWVSLDGIAWGDHENYADSIMRLKQQQLLHRVLISHDAGWYRPGDPNGGQFTGFTDIFTKLLPLLKQKRFTAADTKQLLVINPEIAFTTGIRSIK
jgi:phosphotriesterase-related protein